MFQALIESGPRAPAPAHRYLLSAVVHGAVLVAVLALARPSDENGLLPRRDIIAVPFTQPRPVPASPSQPAGNELSHPQPLSSWQPASVNAPDLQLSAIADALPSVDDLIRGTAAGPAPGVVTWSADAGLPSDGLLTAEAVDDPVGIIEQPAPEYPPALAQLRVAGVVDLSYVVDTLGRAEPKTLVTVRSSHPAFEAAARRTVLASRYRPARLRGVAVRQLVRQRFAFRVMDP